MIIKYENKYEDQWDNLVLNESVNGNFLQTRRFLNYHEKSKFIDHSLLLYKEDRLVAVIPANEVEDGRILISHQGSTFGGIVIKKEYCSTNNYKWIFEELILYLKKQEYFKVELRMPHWLYKRSDNKNELLDYFFQLYGFTARKEVGFFVNLLKLSDDFEKDFDSLRKRKLKKANKNNLTFRELNSDEEIKSFYNVLANNMLKFETVPLHSYEEMLEFKHDRLKDEIMFYGVYRDQELIAGSMVFNFCNKKVFHTQYLASKQECLEYCPNEYLYANLIKEAKEQQYSFLSYGTATLDHGNIYNESLGMYKEGFNTDSYVNTTYIWENKNETIK